MKRVLVVTAVLVLVLGIMSCTPVDQADIQTDTPSYKANEVIETAKQMPFAQTLYGYAEETKYWAYPFVKNLSWTAHYLGDGVWSVMLLWQQWQFNGGGYGSFTMEWHFWEDTAQFIIQ